MDVSVCFISVGFLLLREHFHIISMFQLKVVNLVAEAKRYFRYCYETH